MIACPAAAVKVAPLPTLRDPVWVMVPAVAKACKLPVIMLVPNINPEASRIVVFPPVRLTAPVKLFSSLKSIDPIPLLKVESPPIVTAPAWVMPFAVRTRLPEMFRPLCNSSAVLSRMVMLARFPDDA